MTEQNVELVLDVLTCMQDCFSPTLVNENSKNEIILRVSDEKHNQKKRVVKESSVKFALNKEVPLAELQLGPRDPPGSLLPGAVDKLPN